MNEQIKAVKDKIKELNLSNRTLVYPKKLEDMINATGSQQDTTQAQVAFIRFEPLASKVVIPPVEEEFKAEKNSKLKKGDKRRTKIKRVSLDLDAIILPIVPSEDTIISSWTQVEGMGIKGGWKAYAAWKGYKALSGIASTILPQEAIFAMKSGAFGGGIDNPHDKLASAGHSRRTVPMAWNFMKPQSREDENNLVNILSIFRMSSLAGYGNYVISAPISWKIDFHSLPGYKSYLRYKKVGFNSVSVKFGGEGEHFKAMKTGMPFASLSIDGNELEYPNKDDVSIASGANAFFNEEIREATAEEQAEMDKMKSKMQSTGKK